MWILFLLLEHNNSNQDGNKNINSGGNIHTHTSNKTNENTLAQSTAKA